MELKRSLQRLILRGGSRALAAARWGNGEGGGIQAEKVVWIFGSGRTGSTWLSAMMGELKGQIVWREPLVGALFGNLYYDRAKHLIGRPGSHFILGDGHRKSWLSSVRTFVLTEATSLFPQATGSDNYLVVKEPNGSIGAPILMEALPESRMVLLVRDPRDVVASWLDAAREGGWQNERTQEHRRKQETQADMDPDAFVRRQANGYLRNMGNAKKAYDAHVGHKTLVRYEELRADALGTMRRMYDELGIPVDEKELSRAVEKHAWEKIPKEQKGDGKFYRKARPGGWQEDLTPRQARMVERITAPLLEELYPVAIRPVT